jgi:hypothetical protein
VLEPALAAVVDELPLAAAVVVVGPALLSLSSPPHADAIRAKPTMLAAATSLPCFFTWSP